MKEKNEWGTFAPLGEDGDPVVGAKSEEGITYIGNSIYFNPAHRHYAVPPGDCGFTMKQLISISRVFVEEGLAESESDLVFSADSLANLFGGKVEAVPTAFSEWSDGYLEIFVIPRETKRE